MKKTIIALASVLFALSLSAKTLKLAVPSAQLSGTPVPISIDNLDTYKGPQKEIQVPDDVQNIAKGKEVTSSDDFPMTGEFTLITDGNKDGAEGCYVEIMDGLQWVQIDLGKTSDIYAIAMWHFHSQERAYKDVIVQISDDKTFKNGVKTVFNNDHDGSANVALATAQALEKEKEEKKKPGEKVEKFFDGLQPFAKGDQKAYIETNYGKLIDLSKAPVKGRYVRLYSNGSTTSPSNHYIEVEVFGK